eukprot:850901-Rhodomonas_salina.1
MTPCHESQCDTRVRGIRTRCADPWDPILCTLSVTRPRLISGEQCCVSQLEASESLSVTVGTLVSVLRRSEGPRSD